MPSTTSSFMERGGLGLRLASALVMAPLAVAAAWLGGAYFAALVAAAAAGMGWEWARLTGCGGAPASAVMVAATLIPPLAMAAVWPGAALALALLGAGAVWLAARAWRRPAAWWAAAGTAWIALACLACLLIAADPVMGRAAILWLFATVWATDTVAYVAGRGLGGPRLAPRLSPNKTWAGFVGGVAAAALVGWAAARLTGAAAPILVPAGLALGVAAQLGDLVESLAKRRFGVKDSSHLIPGHGGLLDRLDGMLAAAALQALVTLAAGASPLAWRL